MTKSLALWLSLLAAGGKAPEEAGRRPAAPPGRGPLVWLAAGPEDSGAGLAQLARQMARARPGLRFVATRPRDGILPERDFPQGTVFAPHPAERSGSLREFLDRYRPDLLLLSGAGLPKVLVHEVHARGIPMVLADAQMSIADWRRWRWVSGMAASLLGRFDAILAQDADSARRLSRLGGRRLGIEVIGRIEETTEPLGCNEAEREALAALIRTRQVWLAMGCTEAEEAAVLAAHARAMELAHRMLLILVPADAARGPELARLALDAGFDVARRSAEEEPEERVQVFVADTEGETGLWYRLAPLCFMGGTLDPGTGRPGAGRNPFEPAALGSAILHGPAVAPYGDCYARLHAARAAFRVSGPEGLAEAVGEFIAPDRAAQLAHNAWQVSSGGAGATERVMQIAFTLLDGRQARGAAGERAEPAGRGKGKERKPLRAAGAPARGSAAAAPAAVDDDEAGGAALGHDRAPADTAGAADPARRKD